MSKKVEGNKIECVNSYKNVNENITVLDKKYNGALTSHDIVVIETNLPSSQALKSFSLKLMQIKTRLESEVK